MSLKGVSIAVSTLIPVLLTGCGDSVSFNKDVQPILQVKCISCHQQEGEGTTATGLILSDYQSIMAGTSLGPIVAPGSRISSTLYLVISHQVDTKIQMPPHHHDKYPMGAGEPLSEEQIATIGDWIEQGAKNN